MSLLVLVLATVGVVVVVTAVGLALLGTWDAWRQYRSRQ